MTPSITRQSQRTRQRRSEVEDRVVAATEQLLADGERFTNLGVQRIAEAAGIARSTFYVHFADKSELLMRLSDAATAGIFDSASDWFKNRHEKGVDGLADALLAMISEYRAHSPALRAIAEVSAYDDEILAHWQQSILGFAGGLVDALREDQAAGRVRKDIDIDAAVRFISLGTESLVAQQSMHGDESDDERTARGAAPVIWNAMYG